MKKNNDEKTDRHSRFVVGFAWDVYRHGILNVFIKAWKRYGVFVKLKIGSGYLFLVIDPDDARKILITDRDNYEKLTSYDAVRELLLGNGIFTSIGKQWKKQRRLISPFFTPKTVNEFYPSMVKGCEEMLKRWGKKAEDQDVFEVVDEMMFVTAMIVLKALFSVDDKDDLEKIKNSVETMITFTSGYQLNPLSLPLWIPVKKNRKYLQAREHIHSYLSKVIAQRRLKDQNEWPEDLLSELMSTKDDETGLPMSDELLRYEVITIFFAGHETTARTVGFCLYELSKKPDCQKKVFAEVDKFMTDIPSLEELNNLDYTRRVIKETMRLYPVVPVYIRDAKEKSEINGVPVPAKSTMVLFPYLTHRDERYWDKPEVLDPDRWLTEAGKVASNKAYHPFGMGKRTCMGNNFAILESLMIISTLLRRFVIKTIPGHEIKLEIQGTLISGNGLPMMVERRNLIKEASIG